MEDGVNSAQASLQHLTVAHVTHNQLRILMQVFRTALSRTMNLRRQTIQHANAIARLDKRVCQV
jgi:hypothetical protein